MTDKLEQAQQLLSELDGAEKAQLEHELDGFDVSTPDETDHGSDINEDEVSYRNMYPTTPEYVPLDIETSGLNIQDEVISVGFIFGDTMYLHTVATGFSENDVSSALSDVGGVGDTIIRNILESFSTPSDAITASATELVQVEGVGTTLADRIVDAFDTATDADSLEETVQTHNDVDDLDVDLTLVGDEAELVDSFTKTIQDNFIDEYHVFTTFNGYSRYSGFDFKMLSQAGFYAGLSEHPLNGYGHIDLKTIFDDRDVFNTRVKELSADALSKTFNASPLDEIVEHLQNALFDHVREKAINLNDIKKQLDNITRQILKELDSDTELNTEALNRAISTMDCELSDAELAGIVSPLVRIDDLSGKVELEWNGGSRKKDTVERLEVLDEFGTLNHDAVVEAMESWCNQNDREFPSNTRSTLDGIYDAVQTRGQESGDSVDPLNGNSGRVPTAFDNGNLDDVLLHLADDLLKTRFLSNVMRYSCPSDEFRVTVL